MARGSGEALKHLVHFRQKIGRCLFGNNFGDFSENQLTIFGIIAVTLLDYEKKLGFHPQKSGGGQRIGLAHKDSKVGGCCPPCPLGSAVYGC